MMRWAQTFVREISSFEHHEDIRHRTSFIELEKKSPRVRIRVNTEANRSSVVSRRPPSVAEENAVALDKIWSSKSVGSPIVVAVSCRNDGDIPFGIENWCVLHRLGVRSAMWGSSGLSRRLSRF